MQIKMKNGLAYINNVDEMTLTDEQRKEYFNKIVKILPELDQMWWFNIFLKHLAENYGYYIPDEQIYVLEI